MKWSIGWLLPLCLLCSAPLCLCQKITVRVVDAKNGHPLPRQQVSISFLDGQNRPLEHPSVLALETDAEGQASFALPEPIPAHLSVQVRLTSEHWRCGCAVLAATREILQKGSVGAEPEHTASPASGGGKAGPGQIIFFARPLGLFERLLYPLVKD